VLSYVKRLYANGKVKVMLVLILTIILWLVSGYAIFIRFDLGAYNIAIHMIWHRTWQKLTCECLDGPLGKGYRRRFQLFGH
jgi:hypothetical protein